MSRYTKDDLMKLEGKLEKQKKAFADKYTHTLRTAGYDKDHTYLDALNALDSLPPISIKRGKLYAPEFFNYQEKTAMSEEFQRVKNPTIEQDDAKLIGALGGGYAGLKAQGKAMNFLNKPGAWETLKSLKSTAISPIMAPARMAAGAGLGALAAGIMARYVNKKNEAPKGGLPAGMSMREIPGSKMRPDPITYTYRPNPVEYTFTPPELAYHQDFGPMGKQASIRNGLLGELAKTILEKR